MMCRLSCTLKSCMLNPDSLSVFSMLWPAAGFARASAACAAALCLAGCYAALGDLEAYGRHRVKVMAGEGGPRWPHCPASGDMNPMIL